MFNNKQLLGALLAVLPWAEQIYGERRSSELRDGGKRNAEAAGEALEKAYAVLFRWLTDTDISPAQEAWKIAFRHHDMDGAIRMCAEVNEITIPEAQMLLAWYARLSRHRTNLLGSIKPL